MIKLPALLLGLMLLLTGTKQAIAQDDNVSLQTFYDELSPYGTWIQDPEYGYVWRPDVDQDDFRPYYSNGRWAMTEYGNTWVSDYDWGWAPFHYGRWVTNRYNNWLWIPDVTWGPAWVSWRSGGGYYGWAPLGPRMGVSVNIGFNIPDLWWCFVPQANIYYNRFPRYYAGRNYGIIHRTTYINNVYVRDRNSYYSGPGRDDVRRATRRDVTVYSINRLDRPGRGGITNNKINIYTPRPDRSNNNATAGRPAPRNVAPGSAYTANRGNRGDNNASNNRPSESGREGVRNDRENRGGRNWGTSGDRTQTDQQRQQPDQQRQQRDAQSQEQRQRQREQFEQQRQQRDPQNLEQRQRQREQWDQQRQQRDAQGQEQRQRQQREQSDQQRQQADQQRQQQREQQRFS